MQLEVFREPAFPPVLPRIRDTTKPFSPSPWKILIVADLRSLCGLHGSEGAARLVGT